MSRIDDELRQIAQMSAQRDAADGVHTRCLFLACIWKLGGQCHWENLGEEPLTKPESAFQSGFKYANALNARCLKAITIAIENGYLKNQSDLKIPVD